MTESIYDYTVSDIQGKSISLQELRGKTLLIVNTASKCGFTPQYKGLEKLYKEYKDRGLVILGFPCNQFGNQEPENNPEIANFCEMNYGVTFPMFEKVEVNGQQAAPLFNYLKTELPGIAGSKAIKWNFTKFLVSKDGKPVKRYAPKDTPEKLSKEIEKII